MMTIIVTWVIPILVVLLLLPLIFRIGTHLAFWIVSTINNIRYGPEWNEDGTPNMKWHEQ